ncbi:NucA/NucB deoxyribonuclease domain-containing protein [Streptomyces olivoreticuli]|uniref:NucA/NucB deoxyribonuclease domain-containing protein n=1 Tax=Streptomyces olivoreticuli TaxID=68246 RepID=UPI0013C314CC|nr:hypothetical protein [Streptomyces olivoreticuli]
MAADYDYYGLDECRKRDDGTDVQWYYKNRFAVCSITHRQYYILDAENVVIGMYEYRMTVLGQGYRDHEEMKYFLYIDKLNQIFGLPKPDAPLVVSMTCAAGGKTPNATCEYNSSSVNATIGEWQSNPDTAAALHVSTYGSPGGRDGVHDNQDQVNYHRLEIAVYSQVVSPRAMVIDFRCDRPLLDYGGSMKGGCLYDQVESTLHYSYKKYPNLADHIYTAQKHPEKTYPATEFPSMKWAIPGDKDAKPENRKPLTRLYPGSSPEALSYYDANRQQVQTSCVTAPRPPVGGLECDEYPFASTWEGASYHTRHNDPASPDFKWYYSVRYVPGAAENGPAGRYLADWYVRDHLIAKDPFWVRIDDVPEENK